jgi:hypothetical protein
MAHLNNGQLQEHIDRLAAKLLLESNILDDLTNSLVRREPPTI